MYNNLWETLYSLKDDVRKKGNDLKSRFYESVLYF